MSPDSHFEKQRPDVVGVYQNLPDHAAAFRFDEKSRARHWIGRRRAAP